MPASPSLLVAPSLTAAHFARRFRGTGWLFTAAWIGALALRRLVREGMFGDGLTYAAIARNLAEGCGTSWAPFFSTSFWLPYNTTTTFYDHPPLQFWLQAGLFRLLGDSVFVEKAYCGVLIVLTAGLLAGCWRRLVPVSHPAHSLDWLPAWVWFTFRTAEWASAQNLLDSTLSLFCLLAVWLLLQGGRSAWRSRVWDALAGGALFLALLAKGPVALHGLAVPFLVEALYFRRLLARSIAARTGTLVLVVGVLSALLWQHEPARQFLTRYFQQQVLASLAGSRERTATLHAAGRFYIVQLLLTNTLPALGVSLVLRWAATGWRATAEKVPKLPRVVALGAGLALAASLPITLSVKQYSNYLVPALPYAALALAAWLAPPLLQLLAQTRWLTQHRRAVKLGAITACVVVLLYAARIAGEPFWNEREVLADVHALGRYVPQRANVGVCDGLMRNLVVHSYLQRYHRQELTPLASQPTFVLVDLTCQDGAGPFLQTHGYHLVPTPLTRFRLYQKAAFARP